MNFFTNLFKMKQEPQIVHKAEIIYKPEVVANLCRMKRGDQGTRGMLFFQGFACQTLELPWRDNKRNISCIPSGDYDVNIRLSPKYGEIYHIQKVPNRSYILIHSGNFAGDVEKGFRTHVNGCILLGQKRGIFRDQWAVLNSRITIKRFMSQMAKEPFKLKIHEAF